MRVIATTVQVGALANEVGRDLIDLKVLVGPGIDPHEFEPSPVDLKKIGDAHVVLRNGLGLDSWLDGAISSAGGNPLVATVTDGVPTRRPGGGEPDPHVWHNLKNVLPMIENIANALAKADPAHAGAYRSNAAAYGQKIEAVDRQIVEIIAAIPPANRKMVTDHDAFGYFIERYGLTFVGAVVPGSTTQADTSAKQIAELEDTIRREKVRAIFSQSTVDPKVSQQIARDTGARVIDTLFGDSLGEPGSGQETVDGMLLFNARTIAEALK